MMYMNDVIAVGCGSEAVQAGAQSCVLFQDPF
jgi:hypothetical protein